MKDPLTINITVAEAAELLGISRASAYNAARAGEIPAVRIGRRLLVSRARLLVQFGLGA
jgi:excisionase family DNA binding protein